MNDRQPNVDCVVGLQYGSEAKGLVCQTLADKYQLAVRVGGPNAGHTVRWTSPGGNRAEFKARHIPATVLNRDCTLALAAGALITPQVLDEEIALLDSYGIDVRGRLIVDPNACVIQDRHIAAEHEKKEGSDLNDKIGSTREGVGAALAERVLRRGGTTLAYQEPYLHPYVEQGRRVCDVIRSTPRVLIEASQGCLLSNLHGPYPYATSRDTNVSGALAECGVPPHAVRNVIGVFRTYPIRVAGRSGPTLGRETTWDALSIKLGKAVSEKTTVTKRIRRVFDFSMEEFQYACTLNRPTILALTFLNYLNAADEGVTEFDKLSKESREFIDNAEAVAQCPVLLMSTSADTVVIRPELDVLLPV